MMKKEILSGKQARYILIMFLLGNGVFGLDPAAKQDIWISILLGFLMYLPILLLFLRIASLYPGKNLYDIVVEIFGKIIGRIIVFLYICYAIFLGGAMLRILMDFIHVASLPETPPIIFMTFFIIFCSWMMKSGIEPFGRWCKFLFPFFALTVISTFIISLNNVNFENIKPIGGAGFRNILDSAFSEYAYPLAESVLFLTMLGSIKKTDKPGKIFFTGTSIAILASVTVSIRNIFILGPTVFMLNYPNYAAISTVSLGKFFSRFEVLIGINYVITVLAKTSVCQYAAITGMAKFFNIKNYKTMAFPAGLLMLTLGIMFFPSVPGLLNWTRTYRILAQIFQSILPLMIWIGGEIKNIIKKFRMAAS